MKFGLFIKHFYCIIIWSVEKKQQKVKIQKLQKQNWKIMLLSKCAVRDNKISKLFKEQEASKLLSSLEIKAPLSRILLVDPLSFY